LPRLALGSSRRWILAGTTVALVLVVAGLAPGVARAAAWCGSTAATNRPAVVSGRPIRVIYAIPSDGEDRSAQLAAQIATDVDDITNWWRQQDPTREPRFDLTTFPCGLQVDLTVVRLPDAGAQLSSTPGGANRIFDETIETSRDSVFQDYLVYYDGPVDDAALCGIGYGQEGGPGQAIVYLRSCTGVSSEAVAAHELLHSLGALSYAGPPNACPDSRGHPCDSETDILYPFASGAPLGALVLDYGHDDYYAHGGNWLDVQDSLWLRRVGEQSRLTLSLQGLGAVTSDIPGVDCTASCDTDWDTGSTVVLEATPDPGQRFVRWTGACAGSDVCNVTLDAATSVGALFGKLAYKLTVTVKGKGTVGIAGKLPCRSRCTTSQLSFKPVGLRAKADKGWKFVRWTGACRGTSPLCRVPMSADAAAGVVFKRK
jgi:hypothetical protein